MPLNPGAATITLQWRFYRWLRQGGAVLICMIAFGGNHDALGATCGIEGDHVSELGIAGLSSSTPPPPQNKGVAVSDLSVDINPHLIVYQPDSFSRRKWARELSEEQNIGRGTDGMKGGCSVVSAGGGSPISGKGSTSHAITCETR
jgi:hypothetical protein